ncbi:MAG: response regulator [Thermoanaerobaculia bacterium]
MADQSSDSLLLDLSMPGMDGCEVCARLQAGLRLHDIPVVLVSAGDDVEDRLRAFAAGGVDRVTKPFHVAELSARVVTHARLSRARRSTT